VFDNMDLGYGGELAASLNRYEFLLTAALLLTRGTGSPIDALRCSEVLKPAKGAARKPRRATAWNPDSID
jgi:hypothetical protein